MRVTEDSVSKYGEFWQTLAILYPKLTQVTILTNSPCDFDDDFCYFSTACREVSLRPTKTYSGRALRYDDCESGKSYYDNLPDLNFELRFAILEVGQRPRMDYTPETKSKPKQLIIKDRDMTSEELSP